MTRRERNQLLEQLKSRPNPWTDEQWREWAAVAAADVMDRGFAAQRQPDGSYPMDYAFAVSGHTLVVGPGWNALTREIGSRAASFLEAS